MNTTSRNKNTQIFEFEPENFPSLVLREDLTETWNNISLSSLLEDEQIGLQLLLTASGITEQSDYNPERILLVKADAGVPKQVYGPAIFRDGEAIILRIGDNTGTISPSGDRYLVGNLKGKITVQTKQDISGKDYPVAYCSMVANNKTVFKVRVSLDTQNNSILASDIEATLINEESILPYLAQVPAQAIKMHELGLGEWEIKAISESQGQYGNYYKLHLTNGIVARATGNSQIVLESGYQMRAGTPLTLVVTNIEEIGEGKYRVDNALRERLPRLDRTPTPSNIPTLEAVVEEVGEEKQDLDQIPF